MKGSMPWNWTALLLPYDNQEMKLKNSKKFLQVKMGERLRNNNNSGVVLVPLAITSCALLMAMVICTM